MITKPFVEGKNYTIGVVKELVMVQWFWIVLTDTKNSKGNDSFVLSEEHKLFFNINETNF